MEVQVASRTSRGKAISRRSKPLFDRANTLDKSSSQSPPSSSSSLPKSRSKSISSNFPYRPRVGHRGSGGSARNSSSGNGDIEVGEPCNVYHRRQTEAKRKCGVKVALQLPPSSASVERVGSIGKKFDKIKDEAASKAASTR